MREIFELAAASVVGIDHRRAGKNGHDGFFWELADDLAVAVVCDGCGSGKHSEVGAKLGATILGRELAARIRRGESLGSDSPIWLEVPRAVIEQLMVIAASVGGSLHDAVIDYLLFTVVGVIITPSTTVLFSLGDGVFEVNGDQTELGPYPGNAPPYLSYGLLDEFAPRLNIHHSLETSDVGHVAIATDGASGLTLPELCQTDLLFRNPDGLRRQLFLMTRGDRGRLTDDTTIIALRRRREAA